jgi:hypothetical protein
MQFVFATLIRFCTHLRFFRFGEIVFDLFSVSYRLQGLSRHFLKSLGLIKPSRVRAAAFARLQARLFRLADVELVSVQGSAVWAPDRSASDCEVRVVTSRPSSVLEHEVRRIFFQINSRYDVNMIPIVADRKPAGSSLDSRHTAASSGQTRKKAGASKTTVKYHRQ